jgi:hypothetical protein
MKKLVFLLEEQSMKGTLENIVPRIIRRSLYGLIPRGLPRLKERIYWRDERDHSQAT